MANISQELWGKVFDEHERFRSHGNKCAGDMEKVALCKMFWYDLIKCLGMFQAFRKPGILAKPS